MSKTQPSLLKRLEQQLIAKGKTPTAAREIAVAALQKSGNLKKDSTEPTAKGVARGLMTAEERAKSRAVKSTGGKPSDYIYSSKTNTTRKKKT